MICKQGPLDGCDVPQFGKREFFMITVYNRHPDDHTNTVAHVYGMIRDEWHYQPKATAEATEGIRSQ